MVLPPKNFFYVTILIWAIGVGAITWEFGKGATTPRQDSRLAIQLALAKLAFDIFPENDESKLLRAKVYLQKDQEEPFGH